MRKNRLSPTVYILMCLFLLIGTAPASDRSVLVEKFLGSNAYPAMSYSGWRTTERTPDKCPTVEEIQEDMQILSAMEIKLIRTYNTQLFPQTARTLEAIRQLKTADPNFEMVVMLGAWIQCDGAYGPNPDHRREDEESNRREIETAVRMAAEYPDIVKIIAVGNEAMVTWQMHFVPASAILRWVNHLRNARDAGKIPADTLLTSSDNWAAWGAAPDYRNPDLLTLVKAVDFISMHTYAFHDTYYDPAFRWHSNAEESKLPVTEQSVLAVARALDHQKAQYAAVKQYLEDNGIEKTVHIGETGWASLDNSFYGDGGTCCADEYKAGLFYKAVREWTTDNRITCFYFEGFDEPWKSNGTAGSEGHFGLFTVDGKVKYALWDVADAGAFKGLTRGPRPVVKTHDGDEARLMADAKPPARKKHQ